MIYHWRIIIIGNILWSWAFVSIVPEENNEQLTLSTPHHHPSNWLIKDAYLQHRWLPTPSQIDSLHLTMAKSGPTFPFLPSIIESKYFILMYTVCFQTNLTLKLTVHSRNSIVTQRFYPKGWLAIAMLKPLSLFISLLLMQEKAFGNLKIERWKVRELSNS